MDITILQHKHTKILGLNRKGQISSVQSAEGGSLVTVVSMPCYVMLCCEECPATDVHFALRCVIYHATKHAATITNVYNEINLLASELFF